MAANTASIDLPARRRASTFSRLLKVAAGKPLGMIGLAIVLVLILTAIFADRIAPFGPNQFASSGRLEPPGWPFIMGTDQLGRDVFSRIVYGSRITMAVSLSSVAIYCLIGAVIGLTTGYFGGIYDTIMMRMLDVVLAFPLLILALTIVAFLGASPRNVVAAIAIVGIPGVARVVRGSVLSEKQNQYIEAARIVGCGNYRIIFQHLLPNVSAPLIIMSTLGLAFAILVEASLSFLGLGAPPPAPSWGGMLSGEGQIYFETAPWLAIFPGVAISLAVLGFNVLGDALRDVLDPRLRGV
jgi:ABC-type dipeptide/oligopeptide/nickel transport system permease subunit